MQQELGVAVLIKTIRVRDSQLHSSSLLPARLTTESNTMTKAVNVIATATKASPTPLGTISQPNTP